MKLASNSENSVGFLAFDLGVDQSEINDLTKQLEAIRKGAEAALNIKSSAGITQTLKDANAAAAPLSKTLQALAKDGKLAGDALNATGKSAGASATGVARVKKEIDPLQKSILSLRNETQAYRNTVESADVSNRDAVANFVRLKDASLQLASGLEKDTKGYRDLTGVAASASRSIKTLTGETTRLGFSGNTTVGVLGSMRKGFGGLGAVITPLVGVGGLAGLVKVTGDFVGEAQRANSAAVLFDKSIDRFGLNAGEANDLVGKLSEQFGILPSNVQSAATVMLRAGASLEDVDKALTAAGASAAASGFDIGKAFENVGQAVATGRSELLESSGIITNASTAYEAYAKTVGSSVDELTQAQKVQALSNAIFEESRYEIEDLDSVLTDQVKSQQAFRTALAESRQELGEKFAPVLTKGTEAVTALVGGFGELPGTAQASAAGLGVMATSAVGLSGSFGLLRTASAALFSAPTGLILLGVGAAAGLGTALYQVITSAEDLGVAVQTLGGELEANAKGFATVQTAVGELTKVTDKNGFMGVVETLATTLDEKGAASLKRFATATALPLIAQGDLQGAISETIAKLGELEQATLQTQLAESQRQYNEIFNRATSLKRIVDDLEVRASGANAAFGEASLPFTAADAASLKNYQTQLGETYGLLSQAQIGLNETRTQMDAVNEAQRILNDSTLTAEERLQGFADALGLAADFGLEANTALTGAGAAGDNAAGGVGAVGDAAGKTASQFDAALTASSDWITRLTREVDQNLKPASDVIDTFKTRINELQAEQTRLANAGLINGAQYDLAQEKIKLLVAAVEDLTGAKLVLPDISATVLDPLDEVRNAILGTQQELALSQDAGEAWGEAYTRVFGATGRAATEADTLEKSFFINRTKRQNEDIIAQENLASAVEYYGRTVESSSSFLEAQIEQNQRHINVLRDTIVAQDDWNERLAISNKDLPKTTRATDDFSTALAGLNDNAQGVTSAFDDIDDITGGLEDAADLAKALGKKFDGTGTEAKLLEAKITSLLERGFDPSSESVAGLTERLVELRKEQKEAEKANKTYAENLKVTRDAQEQLADASSIATDDIDELIRSLDRAAEGAGLLGQQARQAQTDLAALQVARDVAFGFDLLGQAATGALEAFPEMATEGKVALGALEGAAGSATAALQDGQISMADGFGIVSSAIDGVLSQLGDDVPAEVKIAGSAISSVFSGAAAGAAFGPWGAVAGGVIGGISGLFGGITEEQRRQAEAQRAFNDELQNTYEITVDIADQNKEGQTQSSNALLDSKLDYAQSSGNYEGKRGKGALGLAQLKIDLITEYEDFQATIDAMQDRYTAIDTQVRAINQQLETGISESGARLTEAQKADLQAQRTALLTEQGNLQTEYDNYFEAFGYKVGALLEQTDQIAKDLGISQQELYTALLTGNDEILGQLTGEQQEALRISLVSYYQAFGVLPEGAAEAAEALGLSTTTLLAELEASDQTLGTAAANGATATREGVDALNQQLIDFFGPEKSAQIRAMILALYDEQATALGEGDQTLAATAQGVNAAPAALTGILDQISAIFGDKAGPIIDLINQTYADMSGAVDTSTTTLSTQATTSGTTLSGDLSSIFNSAKDAITNTAPGAFSSLTDALSGIRGGLGDEGDLLGQSLFAQEQALAERQKQLFREQEIMAGRYGPDAKKALEDQIQAEREALKIALYSANGGGLIGYLSLSETNAANALGSFFNKQGTTLTTQGSQTVGKINNVTGDIRTAMNKLVAASTVGKPGSGLFSFKNPGSGGGGSRPGAAGFFAPLNATIDEHALGGMSSEFGNFDTYGLMQEIEARPFGYGTSFAQVEPDTSYRSGNVSSAGALGGLLLSVQRGVEGYKTGVVGSINSAIKTQQKAFSALSNSFEQGVQTDTERTLKALTEADRKQRAFIKKYGERKSRAPKEEKEAYAANKAALLEFERDTFDIISGRALTGYAIIGRSDGNLTGILGQLLGSKVKLKQGLTEYQQEILDFAKTTGLALEQSVSGGISQGLKTAIKSGAALDFQATLEGLFDTTFDGLFDQLSKQVLAQSLGPLLTDLTADITKGDVNGAAQGVQQIADKLPGIFGKLEQILAPLRGAADRLGFSTPANEPTFENLGQSIKLEARSLGSATPDWFTRMGAYFDTFGRGAELISRAADMQWRAANKIDAAADKLLKGTNAYESRNPQKLTKI